MINVCIVGYGNIGKYVLDTINCSSDFYLCGVIRQSVSHHLPLELQNIKVVDNVDNLDIKPQVAILCNPSRFIPDIACEYLNKSINTIDSYDIHKNIYDVKLKLDKLAQANNCVAITAAGWDPGSNSIIRTLIESCSPSGLTYTNFGPGMSMGHTVAVKNIEGVKSALSITIPMSAGIHRRMVYIEMDNGFNQDIVIEKIKNDSYFSSDETHVTVVSDVNTLIDMGHGVNMIRKGSSGSTHNQIFEFNMRINNPALTAQNLVNCARASLRQNSGCYTMIEISVIDLLHGTKEDIIRRLV